jgi:hypothetical protein
MLLLTILARMFFRVILGAPAASVAAIAAAPTAVSAHTPNIDGGCRLASSGLN